MNQTERAIGSFRFFCIRTAKNYRILHEKATSVIIKTEIFRVKQNFSLHFRPKYGTLI